MKIVCFILVLAVCINLIIAQRCDTGEDCREGYCCVTKIPGIFWIPMGSCKRLLREGDECMPDFLHNMAGEGKYFVKCPCMEGLDCEKERKYSQKSKCINPNPSTTTAQPTEKMTTEKATTEKMEITTPQDTRNQTSPGTDSSLDSNSTTADVNSTLV